MPGRKGPAGTRIRCPRSPGDPWAQYIRSGPEGAQGVLGCAAVSLSACTLPCTSPALYLALHLALLLALTLCTIFLKFTSAIFVWPLQIGFLQVVFFLVVFPKEIFLNLDCLWGQGPPGLGRACSGLGRAYVLFSHQFLNLVFSRFLWIFNGFWLPFGLHFLSFFIIFASLFRASVLHRFFIDLGMVFSSIFHHVLI